MKKLKFICKNCKGTKIDCIESLIQVIYPIREINEENIDYDISNIRLIPKDDIEIYYKCTSCGEVIRDNSNNIITNGENLFEYLQNKKYNK